MNLFARSIDIVVLPAPPRGPRRRSRTPALPCLLAGLLLALCCLVLTGAHAGAAPDGASPPIVAAEPTPDVHEPPIDDRAPVPTAEPDPTHDPIDEIVPAPSPQPSPSPEPIDEIVPAPTVEPDPDLPISDAPDGGDGPGAGIEITKAECPTDYEVLMQSLDEHIANCQGDGAGFVFHLVKDGEDIAQDTVKHMNSPQGFASWIGFAPGAGQIVEEIPAGYLAPLVYCQLTLADGAPQGYQWMGEETFDGSLDVDLSDGERLHCYWFNFPTTDGGDDGSDIVVHKWDCPSGYDAYQAGLDELLATCTVPMDGVVFTLFQGDGMNASAIEDTTVAGDVGWEDVALGPFTLAEAIPVGYSAPLVDCRWAAVDDGLQIHGAAPLQAKPNGTHTGEMLFANTSYICNWFNVPIDGDDEDGTLVVYKYLCDGDVFTADACAPANAEFMLSFAAQDGEPFPFETGDDGVWSMDLSDGGFWVLTEQGAEPCWIASPDFTEGGTLPTTAGHVTVVEVFNCTDTPGDGWGDTPGDEPGKSGEPNEPVITTLPDTGSGGGRAAGPEVRFGGPGLVAGLAGLAGLALLAAALMAPRRRVATRR